MTSNLQSEGRTLGAAAPASFTFGAQGYSPSVTTRARLRTLPQRITPVDLDRVAFKKDWRARVCR